MSSILRSSKFVNYFFGLARGIIISNRQHFDGLIQKNQNLVGLSYNFSTSHINLQSDHSLEQTLRQLDEEARRTGRVSIDEVEEALKDIKNKRRATASQSLLIIRCCGNLVPEETPEQRTKLVQEIWNTFSNLGVPLDISHYNALLKVYLENEHKFSPTEFLAKLDANGIEPNRVTYQRLIAGFCQEGDIAGATKILEFMKEKQLPVSEGVFNALVLGHSKADDMESAEGILSMMRQTNLEPSNETYTTLLKSYAARGDAEAVERVLTECKVKDILLTDRDYLEIVYVAAVNGHDQLFEEVLKKVRRTLGYNQDAVNVFIRLITAGKDEAAYKVFLSLNPPLRSETSPNMSGHIFIKHLVKSNRSVDQILSWCDRLQEDGHTSLGLWFAVEASFHHGNTHMTIDLLRALKQKGEPIRPHYFWPPLVTAGKIQDFDRMVEILKHMSNEFDTVIGAETVSTYVLPYIAKTRSTTEIIDILDSTGTKRAQTIVGFVSYLLEEKRVKEAAELAMQNPGFNYRFNLSARQLKDVLQSTDDVPSVVKLLHVLVFSRNLMKEDHDEEAKAVGDDDIVTKFLINIVAYKPTQKYIEDVLKEMLDCGIPISNVCAEKVQNILQGEELTSEITGLLAKLSSGEIILRPIKRTSSASSIKTPEYLTNVKNILKAKQEPAERIISVNKTLFKLYCQEGDLENALKIKEELEKEYNEEVTLGMLAKLLECYCMNNDLEGAKTCLEKIKTMTTELELDAPKILKLAKLYAEKNQINDAESLLSTVKPREVSAENNVTRLNSWQLLQAVAETSKDPEKVKQMLNLLSQRKYIDINNIMLGSVIKAYLLRDDVEGALKEFEECVKLYRATPHKNELSVRFIEKEDATNLQKVVDLSTEIHGEVNSLYDLVLSFIECSKIRQARKILETPGLTNRSNRLLVACERYKKEGKISYLEGLLEATKDVAFIDRSEIYNSLLDCYCRADDADKALGLWTKMQDEDASITDDFLIKLGKFLEEKGYQVPFQIPKTVSAKAVSVAPPKKIEELKPARSPLLVEILRRDVDEALKIKDEMESKGKQLTKAEVSKLLELLVKQSRFREATALVTSLQEGQWPNVRTLNFLITRLAGEGEVDLMQQLASSLSEELKKSTSFSSRFMSAAVLSGRGKEELDRIEKELDSASNEEEIDRTYTKFPHGGILYVLTSSPNHYDQVARIVDKFYNKGSSGPANTLVMHHMIHGDVQKAHELFQKYNLNNSSHIMFRSVINKAKSNQDPKLLEELLSLISTAPCVSSEAKAFIYSSLINIYSDQKEYDTAMQKLEDALKTIPLDLISNSTLVNLKKGLEASNKTFKYTIPTQKQKELSSSSSSSSETEPKKSVASN